MNITITHRNGEMETNPTDEKINLLLKELKIEDVEHSDISIQNEEGWSISAFPSGLVIFENIENPDNAPQHMKNVMTEDIGELFFKLNQNKLDLIRQEKWKGGYGR